LVVIASAPDHQFVRLRRVCLQAGSFSRRA
jgi:hypothetical protein